MDFVGIIGCATMLLCFVLGVVLTIAGPFIGVGENDLVEDMMKDASKYKGLAANEDKYDILPIASKVPDDFEIGLQFSYMGFCVLISGILVLLYGLIGFIGIFKNLKPALIASLFLLLGAVVVQALAVTTQGSINTAMYTEALDKMKHKLKNNYQLVKPISTFTKAFNAISLNFKCCGLTEDIEDFPVNITFNDGKENHRFQYPPLCCKDELYDAKKDEIYSNVLRCAQSQENAESNQKGCFEEIYNYIQENGGDSLRVWCGILFALETFSIILIVMKCMSKAPEDEGAMFAGDSFDDKKKKKDDEMERGDDIEAEAPRRVFKPYFKVSSYMKWDTSRIPSTEIW